MQSRQVQSTNRKLIFSQSISLLNSRRIAFPFLTNYNQILALKSYLQHKQHTLN